MKVNKRGKQKRIISQIFKADFNCAENFRLLYIMTFEQVLDTIDEFLTFHDFHETSSAFKKELLTKQYLTPTCAEAGENTSAMLLKQFLRAFDSGSYHGILKFLKMSLMVLNID